MTAPETGPALHEWPGGLTWLARPEEGLQRASHAIVDGDDLWVVDPVVVDGVYDELEARGAVAGVVMLLDRHARDAAAVAKRYGVPVYVPDFLTDAADGLGVDVERFAGQLGGTGYRAIPVVVNRAWREGALVSADGDTAIVPEAVGTNPFSATPSERAGVHAGLRLWPPRDALGDLDPERLLVGHGAPVLEGGGDALQDALTGSRRRAPRAFWGALAALVRGGG